MLRFSSILLCMCARLLATLCCAGCTLPIQVVFPASESPSGELVNILKDVGAVSASMPRSLDHFIARANGEKDAQMAGFMLKIAAIILSTFQEVRFQLL